MSNQLLETEVQIINRRLSQEFNDSICFKKIKEEWQGSLPKYSNSEWLEIFPEAKEYLREKYQTGLKRIEALSILIKEALSNIRHNPKGEFIDWLRKEIVEVFLGADYNNLFKETSKIARLIKPPEPVKNKNSITTYMIEKARATPIEQILDVNRGGWANCLWHEDKHPSLYCKGGFVYCFSCGKHADAIDVVKKLRNCSFLEAVKILN